MSKLEELIEQYCPDGVEYYHLNDVATIKRGERVTKAQLIPDGQYPVISGGVKPLGCLNKYNREANTITIAQYGTAGYVDWQQNQFWANDVCYSVFPSKNINNRFLFFVLLHNQQLLYSLKTNAIPACLPLDRLAGVEIPVPPLSVQEEIVRILDTFTELQAELQAELQKRLQQYNYYRDNLLSNGGNNAEYLAIPEFAELKAGKAIKATELSSIMDENHSYPCFGGNGIRGFIKKVSHNGDYAIIGRQGALCGCVNWASGEFYATEHAVVCTPRFNVSSRYLYHLFTVADLNQYKSQGAQPGLSVQRLNELVFPIPSIVEQQRIVSILDRFDTLTNDLAAGLPAEIEKRRQQYGYYRDKLLTFKRKEA